MLVIPAPGWRQEVPQSLRREHGPAHTWIVTSGLQAVRINSPCLSPHCVVLCCSCPGT